MVLPRAVKSDRRSAILMDERRWDMRRAAGISLEQVKQWAKIAVAFTAPVGMSMIAASSSPAWPVKVIFCDGIGWLLFEGHDIRWGRDWQKVLWVVA
mgnify:CR=1 FL=1